jgi:hypothetical protein
MDTKTSQCISTLSDDVPKEIRKLLNDYYLAIDQPDIREKLIEFANKISIALSKEDVFSLVDDYVLLMNKYALTVKIIYNHIIGWALPSRETCNHVLMTYEKHIEKYPDAKIIDLGAGSGIFSYMFNEMGIPGDKILAVDMKIPTHTNPEKRNFWPIHNCDNYVADKNDILFIAWGIYALDTIVSDYNERGGTCVIIVGEMDGCTYSPGKFLEYGDDHFYIYPYVPKNEWTVNTHFVPAAAKLSSETLSVNTRYG